MKETLFEKGLRHKYCSFSRGYRYNKMKDLEYFHMFSRASFIIINENNIDYIDHIVDIGYDYINSAPGMVYYILDEIDDMPHISEYIDDIKNIFSIKRFKMSSLKDKTKRIIHPLHTYK